MTGWQIAVFDAFLSDAAAAVCFRPALRSEIHSINEAGKVWTTVTSQVKRPSALRYRTRLAVVSEWVSEWLVCEGDEDEEEGEEGSKAEEGSEAPKVPSLGDYIMHCLSLFWKVLFAFVPPTGQAILSLELLTV